MSVPSILTLPDLVETHRDFFDCLFDSLPVADQQWVASALLRYAAINERPGAPRPRL